MSYTLLPNTGQSLGFTRDLIKTNFTIIQTAFNVDHVNYDATGEGKHNKVSLVKQASDPGSAADECIIYAKTTSNITMPYYQRDNAATVLPCSPIKAIGKFQFTSNSAGNLIDDGSGTWNILSASVTASTAGSVTVTFNTKAATPMRTNTYAVFLTTTPLPGFTVTGGYYANGAGPTSTTAFYGNISAAVALPNLTGVVMTVMAVEF